MDQGQKNQQYGYGQYDNFGNQSASSAPSVPYKRSIIDKILGERMAAKMRSPVFATVMLLTGAAAFAAVIMMSYPGDGHKDGVPVISAQTQVFKEAPEDRGGMDVPHKESTIFAGMTGEDLKESAPVENLLVAEKPIDKLEVFAREVEEIMAQEEASRLAKIENLAEQSVKSKEILQKVEKISPADRMAQAQKSGKIKTLRKPDRIHAAGSSPETLAFVRSVLDQKDTKQLLAAAPAEDVPSSVSSRLASAIDPAEYSSRSSSAAVVGSAAQDVKALAVIEPAAGMASVAGKAFALGNFFVQLGSVRSEAGAAGEWGKLQKAFASELQNASYRVQRADLGERGIYYRIQAGPMSRASADEVCGSIKAQKPGGCLVVKGQ